MVAVTRIHHMIAPYEVFLSFKNLDTNGKQTEDSLLAETIYQTLTLRGVRTFLSTFELEKLGVAAYKRAIDDALDEARTLVVVGTKIEYIESEWVRYEWDSFFNDVISGIKSDGRVFVYSRGLDSKLLPRSLRQCQMITHSDQSLDLLMRFISSGRKEGKALSDSQKYVLGYILCDVQCSHRGVAAYPLHQQLTYRGFSDPDVSLILNSLVSMGCLVRAEAQGENGAFPVYRTTQLAFELAELDSTITHIKQEYLFRIVLSGSEDRNSTFFSYLRGLPYTQKSTRFLALGNEGETVIGFWTFLPPDVSKIRTMAEELGVEILRVEES